jgi:hypothetical protein
VASNTVRKAAAADLPSPPQPSPAYSTRDDFVPRMLKYCEQNLTSDNRSSYGHWHYAHFYYSQVQYREGGERWERYRNEIRTKLLHEAQEVKIGDKTGAEWTQGYIGPIYTTALNLIILQLDNACLPIYQR